MTQIKICPECQEEFEGRSNKKFCSASCKMEAYQKRQLEESNDESSKSIPVRLKGNNHKNATQRNLSSKEVKLRLHTLDLQHQRKLILLDQQKQIFEQRAKQEEMDRKRIEEELAVAKAKKEKELKEKLLIEADRKAFNPIKTATQDILNEIIENGKDAIWPVEEIEDILEDIDDTIAKLKKYHLTKQVHYTRSEIYTTLNELEEELQELLDEESNYVNAEEVVINFKKSYIRELKTVLQELENS